MKWTCISALMLLAIQCFSDALLQLIDISHKSARSEDTIEIGMLEKVRSKTRPLYNSLARCCFMLANLNLSFSSVLHLLQRRGLLNCPKKTREIASSTLAALERSNFPGFVN